MKKSEVRDALQDLIVRLQDAETGYKELEKAASVEPMRKWLSTYAKERHNMHRKLEDHVEKLGGDPEVKTSFLGEMHKMFIDIKINNVGFENEFGAIANEIERGATKLCDDYQNVLENVELPADVVTTLISQKTLVETELTELVKLREEIESVDA